MTVFEKAYAKINLYLSVGARRPDGYHELTTLMQTVALFDELKVTLTPSDVTDVTLTVLENTDLVTDGRNLAVRAALAYLESAKLTCEVRIELKKRIPVAAGMAGGSADAAAVLRALNGVCRAMDDDRLLDLAATLGSDVPFCLIGGCAVCRGRGERISPVLGAKAQNIVLAMSGEPVSTPDAFRTLDLQRASGVATANEEALVSLVEYLQEGGRVPALYNSFEEAILPTLPIASELHSRLCKTADAVLMSGSGSTVFGVFASEDDAKEAANALVADGYRAIAISTKI